MLFMKGNIIYSFLLELTAMIKMRKTGDGQ